MKGLLRYLIPGLLIFLILLAGCVTGPGYGTPTPTATPDYTRCTNDSQCVPAQCCHPTSCINAAYKEVCTELCTLECKGPIDCGAGHCACVDGTCKVIPGSEP